MGIKKKYFLIGPVFLILGFLVYCFYPVINYDSRYSQHINHNPTESLAPGRVYLEDRNGKIITDKAYPNGYYKFIKTDLESSFVKALLEIEDKNFYNHIGVNLPAKLRAFKDNITGRRVSGGSTITEQYVKNKYFRGSSRSYLQKLREALVALYVDASRDKDQILSIYYHDAYFGNGLYGIGAALEVYFDKQSLDELSEEEIVLLLSLLNNPGIDTLEEQYFRDYFEQVQVRLGYSFDRTIFGKLPRKQNLDRFPFVTSNYAKLLLDEGELNTGSFVEGVIVSIDSQLQEFTRDILQKTLEELADKNVTNSAVFAINPKTGEVLIYQGSKDFYARDIDGQVDVIKSMRQPGSTVKPFLYLMALQQGAHPDSLILDIESEYNSFREGKVYVSENYSLKEYGLVRLKKALGNSFNNATVRLARELGLSEVYDFYTKYGFHFSYPAEHYGYSLVLGNASMSLENLVRSYTQLLDLSDPDTFLLYEILSDPDNRDISFGVNSILTTSVPQAVKTGTSSDFRDNLVISYHPDLVLGVWVGNNDNSSMQGVTGITGAGYIWHQVIEKAIELGYINQQNMSPPEGIQQISYCLDTSCFRKQNSYAKTGVKYYSAIIDQFYDKSDIFEQLSDFEISKLDELKIQIK